MFLNVRTHYFALRLFYNKCGFFFQIITVVHRLNAENR
jgi:hypothetical protein